MVFSPAQCHACQASVSSNGVAALRKVCNLINVTVCAARVVSRRSHNNQKRKGKFAIIAGKALEIKIAL